MIKINKKAQLKIQEMKSEKITSKWYDKVGENCLKYYKKSQITELILLKKLIKNLPKNSLILDVGCGAGFPVDKFLSEKGFRIIGIDISKEMIKKAKKNVPEAKFKIMSMYNLKFPVKKFDAIICFFAILHLEKKKVLNVFKKFNKILNKDGYLLFSVNKGNHEGYYKFFDEEVYFSAYTKKEIKHILRKSNFKIVRENNFIFKKRKVAPGRKTKENHIYYLAQKR